MCDFAGFGAVLLVDLVLIVRFCLGWWMHCGFGVWLFGLLRAFGGWFMLVLFGFFVVAYVGVDDVWCCWVVGLGVWVCLLVAYGIAFLLLAVVLTIAYSLGVNSVVLILFFC